MCKSSELCLVEDPSVVSIGDQSKTTNYVILFFTVSGMRQLMPRITIPVWKNEEYANHLKRNKKAQ
jgi:hypothetical protein